MSNTAPVEQWSEFSVVEWQRLDSIAGKYDAELKGVWLKTMVLGIRNGEPLIRELITNCVVEVGVSTADRYGFGFNAQSPRWPRLIDNLTTKFMGIVNNDEAKEKVAAILPAGIPLADRNNRLDVFGLSARDAVRIERMRQQGITGTKLSDARLNLRVQRGNIVALTEVNRFINATLESLWLDNSTITKARNNQNWLLENEGRVTNITSLRGIPSRARKAIVTRRDNRVCEYCIPLEGKKAKIGTKFNTEYGLFDYPPFHPRCRCYMIVSF